MSLSISESRSALLAEARSEFNRQAALKATISGTKQESVPPDSVLIATDATLSKAIQASDTTTVTAAASVSLGSSSTSSSNTSSSDSTSGQATENGQILNVIA